MSLEAYLSELTVTQGRRAGEPFAVLPWQGRFLRGAFAPGAGTAALSVARGNGKSTLVAGIAAAALAGPLMVARGETIIVASSFAQATICFDHVVSFMGPKLRDRKKYKFWQTGQLSRIEDRETGASVRAIGSDPKRAHGLAPVLILCDEPAQWPSSSGDRMLAALRTSLGKQPGARLIACGTRPASAEHWFAKMLAGTADYSQSHAAGEDDPPFQRRTWARANPSLDHMPDLEAAIRTEAGHAKTDGSVLHEFRSLRLNSGTSEVAEAVLVEAGTWGGIEGEAERAGPLVWGADLGTSAAMSAIAAYFPTTGRLETVAAFPLDPPLAERGLRDGVGALYADCARRGELIQTGHRAVDLDGLLIEALSRFGRPNVIAADRWREAELRDALDRAGVPPGCTGDSRPRIQRRRRGCSRLSSCDPGGQGDAHAHQVIALCHGRGARALRPGRQRQAGQARRGRAPLDCAGRCSSSGDPGRCGGRAPGHGATSPPSTSCACRMSRHHASLNQRRWKAVRRAVVQSGRLALRRVRPAGAPGVRSRHAVAARAGARPVGFERASNTVPCLPPGKDDARERPRAGAESAGMAGVPRRAFGTRRHLAFRSSVHGN